MVHDTLKKRAYFSIIHLLRQSYAQNTHIVLNTELNNIHIIAISIWKKNYYALLRLLDKKTSIFL